MGIISVEIAVVQRRLYFFESLFKRDDAWIDDVGNNSGLQHLKGQKFPIRTLQEWASKP